MTEDHLNSPDYITVKLSHAQYENLISILNREQAVSWFWKWAKSFIFAAAGGILAIYTLVQAWNPKT